MNRSQRHQQLRENKNYVRTVNKFTKAQMEVIDSVALQKATQIVGDIGKTINKLYFQALRDNHVGEARALKIIEDTNLLMLKSNE